MNYRILGTVSITALVTANAVSAGSPEPMVTIIPPVVASVTSSPFDGFYVGASVTSTSADMSFSPNDILYIPFDGTLSGVGGEVHAGYNFAPSNGFFYGGELSYGMPAASGEDSNGTFTISSLISAQGRIGYVAGPLMYYGMAGYALAEVDMTTDLCSSCEINVSSSGYVVGAGVEYLISDNLSVRGQYAYYDFGEQDTTYDYEGFNYVGSTSLSAGVLSVGMNYHF